MVLKLIANLIKVIISFALTLISFNCQPINDERSGEDYYNTYNEYYNSVERKRERNEMNMPLVEPEITLWQVMLPFLISSWIIIAIILVCICGLFVTCIIQSCDLNQLFHPLESLECQGYHRMNARLEKLEKPGLYITPEGNHEYYTPDADEEAVSRNIADRLGADQT